MLPEVNYLSLRVMPKTTGAIERCGGDQRPAAKGLASRSLNRLHKGKRAGKGKLLRRQLLRGRAASTPGRLEGL